MTDSSIDRVLAALDEGLAVAGTTEPGYAPPGTDNLDVCWRCTSAPPAGDLGLCAGCRTELADEDYTAPLAPWYEDLAWVWGLNRVRFAERAEAPRQGRYPTACTPETPCSVVNPMHLTLYGQCIVVASEPIGNAVELGIVDELHVHPAGTFDKMSIEPGSRAEQVYEAMRRNARPR